jgi:hypothetical protein
MQCLIVPHGSVLPEGFPLELVTIAQFGDIFKLELTEDTILMVPAKVLSSWNKVLDELPCSFAHLIGVPQGVYDISWEQASIMFPEVSFMVLMEQWSKEPAEKVATKLVDSFNNPERKLSYRHDAPDPEEI